jgi:hypothetical protein
VEDEEGNGRRIIKMDITKISVLDGRSQSRELFETSDNKECHERV